MRRALPLLVAACGSTPPRTVVAPPPAPTPTAPVADAFDPFSDVLVADAKTCKQPAAKQISRADALADLDTVERILRRGYVAFELLNQRGVNWDRKLHTMRAEIAAMREPIRTAPFLVWLGKQLAETKDHSLELFDFAADGARRSTSAGGHEDAYTLDLTVDESGNVLASGDARLVGLAIDDCSHATRKRTLVGPQAKVGERLIALATQPPEPSACTFHRSDGTEVAATLPFHRLSIGTDTGPVFEQKDRVVPVLRVRSLDEVTHANALEKLGYASNQNFQHQAMVLDLRGVAPGDYDLTYFFQSLLGARLQGNTRRSLDSEVVTQGEVNAAACATPPPAKPADPDAEPDTTAEDLAKALQLAREDLAERAKKSRAERTWSRMNVAVSVRVGGRLPSRPYQGVFIMVVDSHCTGTCEEAVALARQLPRTIILGENTAGVGEIDEPRPYRLPRSGLWLAVGSQLHGSTTEEGMGHVPDFWLDTTKAEDEIDAAARCAIDAGCARYIVTSR